MNIDAKTVKKLRIATGAGMMECKQALLSSKGEIESAKDYLRKKGLASFQKRSSRSAQEGGVAVALSSDGKVGVMIQLGCETDFVARNEEFVKLLDGLAKQALENTANITDQPAPDGDGSVQSYIVRFAHRLGENLELVKTQRLEATPEGIVESYVHTDRQIGVLVNLSVAPAEGQSLEGQSLGERAASATNVVTNVVDTQVLREVGRDLAMHIAASDIIAIHPDEIDENLLAEKKEIFISQVAKSNKPPEILEKMISGHLQKFVKEVALLAQPFVKDAQLSVEQWLGEVGRQWGASIRVNSFIKLRI